MRRRESRASVLVAFCIAVIAACAAMVSPAPASGASAVDRQIIAEMNRVRADHGLQALRQDGRLARAAHFHSADMMRRGYFDHGDFGSRLSRFGVRGSMGENIAWGSGPYGTAAAIVQQWLNSPPHRAIMLSPRFHLVGVGSVRGTFSGYAGARVVTADFAG